MNYPHFERLDLADKRTVYAVGDIHGRFDLLRHKLYSLNFDKEQDFLISVGDLVDRGPYSDEAGLWIEKSWFKHVIGNHEVLVHEANKGEREAQGLHLINGGEWILKMNPAEREAIDKALMSAPYVLEILSPKENKIGFVHADIPGNDWELVVQDIQDPQKAHSVKDYVTWSRESVKVFGNIKYKKRIKNIDHVFLGHTPKKEIKTSENMTWIDTGAFATNNLSIVNVDDYVRKLVL